MSENKKLELLDQYDDVTFALLMDEYAEEEGARLRKEFEEAQAAGEVSDTSDALDEKCLQMIHRDFAKKRSKENVRKIIRMTSKVAVAVMVFLGVLTTTVMSVDALRVPVFNFIIERFDGFTSIRTQDIPDASTKDPFTILEGLIPMDYAQTLYSDEAGMMFALYENTNENSISLDVIFDGVFVNIDTENAEYSEIFLSDYKAILIEKNGYQVIWTDDEKITYTFYASSLPLQQVLEICENLIQSLLSVR